MGSKVLWLALAFMLMFEGALPLIAPALWQRLVAQLSQLPQAQIRFCGLLAVLGGLALYALLGL